MGLLPEVPLREALSKALAERRDALPRHFREARSDTTALGNDGAYIFGPVGVGKSYLAAALANQAIDHGLLVAWVTVPAWLEAKRAAMNGAAPPATIDEIVVADVVVFDDIGAEKSSDWSREVLFGLVNAAYENDVQVIATSNRRLADLSSHLGERIGSRIAEMCRPFEVRGDDRRLCTERGALT